MLKFEVRVVSGRVMLYAHTFAAHTYNIIVVIIINGRLELQLYRCNVAREIMRETRVTVYSIQRVYYVYVYIQGEIYLLYIFARHHIYIYKLLL